MAVGAEKLSNRDRMSVSTPWDVKRWTSTLDASLFKPRKLEAYGRPMPNGRLMADIMMVTALYYKHSYYSH